MKRSLTDIRKSPYFIVLLLLFIKLVLLRYFFFHSIQWSRLPSDALALLALVSLFELITPARWKGLAFWLFNALFSLLLFSSTLYFQHFGSVPTYTALLELNQVLQIRASVQSTIQLVNYLFFADIIMAAAFWFIRKMRGAHTKSYRPVWKTGVLLAAALSLTISARYIQLGDSISNEVMQAQHIGFFDYQVAAAVRAHRENQLVKNGNLKDTIQKVRQLEASYPYKQESSTTQLPVYFGAAKGMNLIVVQMEAFQNFPIHLSLNKQPLTPVLNKLADDSLYFPHVFQQIGQGNTSDAEFMSNTSIYPTGTIAMSTGYGDRQLPSLPRTLVKHGYEANTFHVNNVQFWDRIKLYPALGFSHYYDKPFYKNDHFNDFGASDEELYRVGMEKMLGLQSHKKPFYSQFITVSSHFPFNVPDDRKRIDVPASMQGKQLGDYLSAVNYTDYALGTLIDSLKAQGLWDKTMLVVYGDHFGLQPQDNDAAWISSQLGITYDPRITRFNIPLIIHLPGMAKGKVIDQVGGQLDIMPTVANLLGLSLPQENVLAFGHDLLNIDHNAFGMRYYLPTGSFFNNDVLFVPGKGFEDGTAVSLKTLQPVKDITPYRKDYEYILKLMGLSDEYVKLLPKRGP